jgi:hypothetical protein
MLKGLGTMHKTPCLVALLTAVGGSVQAQQPPDTTLTLHGFVQEHVGASRWAIVTPFPVAALGVQTYVVSLGGTDARWLGLASRYVEATGRITRSPATRAGIRRASIRCCCTSSRTTARRRCTS